VDGENKKFWQHKSLSEMSASQWEALCDGCGRCCLHKLEDADTGEIFYTSIACHLLDIHRCHCTAYSNRAKAASDCLVLILQNTEIFSWLPKTCAYRRLFEGRALPPWHPLVSGDPESVHAAGISLRHRAVSDLHVNAQDFENYIIDIDH